MKQYIVLLVILILLPAIPAKSQDKAVTTAPADSSLSINIDNMDKDAVLRMSLEDLLKLPFEFLLKLSKKLGVSVEELLTMKISAASKNELTPRESPGIVTVITDEEIRKSGARDLIDVLRLVPGYSFGHDVAGVTGPGSRGLWAHEGKVLLLIDGQEMNELYYSNIPMSNHYNIDNIKRIEIVRGPGSSIYGGNAELGVINIITKQGDELRGGSVNAMYGRMDNIYGHANVSAQVGDKIKDFEYSISQSVSQGNKTDYVMYNADTTWNYKNGYSGTRNQMLNINMKYKGLKTTFIIDNYNTSLFKDSTGITTSFKHISGDIRYDIKLLRDNLTITPRFNFQKSTPWFVNKAANKTVEKYTGGVIAKYDLNKNINLIAGSEFMIAEGRYFQPTDTFFKFNEKPVIDFYNQAYYVQGLIKAKYFNLTVGGRYDNIGSIRGDSGMLRYTPLFSSFAPRIGITKVIHDFHFKFLMSKAFRSPSIGNMAANRTIRPENTYIQELEIGYKISKKIFITGNFFNQRIVDPIVYDNRYSTTWYDNSIPMGTMGTEFEFRYRSARWYASANYSFYAPGNLSFFKGEFVRFDKPVTNLYSMGTPGKEFLGMPQHKIAINQCINFFNNKLTVNNSLIYSSRQYAWSYNPDGLYQLYQFYSSWMWNIYAEYQDLFINGLNVGVGVFDILNKGPFYAQPYLGHISPLPGPTREFTIRIIYNFKFAEE